MGRDHGIVHVRGAAGCRSGFDAEQVSCVFDVPSIVVPRHALVVLAVVVVVVVVVVVGVVVVVVVVVVGST